MPIYRPRMLARIFVPNVGTAQERTQQEELDDVVQLQVRINYARLSSNNYDEADECEVRASYDEIGLDPRLLRSCELYLYLGDGDQKGNFTASADNQRFVGIAVDVERDFAEDGGKTVLIKAQDYTCLFIAAKPYPASGALEYTDTLPRAWQRLCDHTGYYNISTREIVSTVQRLRDRIEFHPPELESLTLGEAVQARIAKLGKVQPSIANASAWAIWQTAVGSLGLISFIRGDRCIVTTATDYYTADDPPRFVYGKNIARMKETRDVHSMSAKNVCIRSLNPLTMQMMEAYWPPPGSAKSKGGGTKKKLGASALGAGQPIHVEDYECFDCPLPISDQGILDRFAQRVWEVRSRQELRGELTTAEMFTDTLGGDAFDLLKLQSGDRVRVEIDQQALTVIQRLRTIGERVKALTTRGYSDDMAAYLAKNLDSIVKLTPEFQVHSVEAELDVSDPDSGRYDMQVKYVNRIDVSGSSSPGEGEGTPPITNQRDTVAAAAERRRNSRTPL